MIKLIQKLIKRQKMRKEAREAAYGVLCEEQKDTMLFSWEGESLREKSRQTRQAWIMAALDGNAKKQQWLVSCIEIGIIKIK